MRMDDQEESSNVEDVRGSSGRRGSFRVGGRPIGLGAVAVALVAGWILGVNPLTVLDLLSGGDAPPSASAPATPPPAGDPQARFVSQVLRSTEVVWADAFHESGMTYQNPRLRLFRGSYPSACGEGDAARQRASETQANALSVRVELQADCFAGVWAKRSQAEQGDIETALNAAAQIGDDTLQRKSRGQVVPESFTHGTSAQRVGWFKRGFESGNADRCDTFKAG